MNHFQYRSAHILRTLCNKINYTGKIRRVSGQSISNPLLNPLLKYSTIFNFKARKYSTEASEDQKSPADNNNNPFVSDPSIPPTERVLRLVDDIAGLTLNEVTDLTDLLRTKFHIKEMPIMTMMMPGMGMPLMPGVGVGANAGGESKADEKKAAKSFFDLKLESFDAASKIKVIKEVRTFTDLGLKEAKDLVEKAPGLLKKGVGKEEAEQIIAKMKDLGAKVIME